jgi:SAM-dependent methyltransferase
MVSALRGEDQDFEWYPTTLAMIDVVIADAKLRLHLDPNDDVSVLDIGAGDGRVLARFHAVWPKGTFFSIEKSSVLQAAQPDWVVPAGTDFREQDLMALRAGAVDISTLSTMHVINKTLADALALVRTARTHEHMQYAPQSGVPAMEQADRATLHALICDIAWSLVDFDGGREAIEKGLAEHDVHDDAAHEIGDYEACPACR